MLRGRRARSKAEKKYINSEVEERKRTEPIVVWTWRDGRYFFSSETPFYVRPGFTYFDFFVFVSDDNASTTYRTVDTFDATPGFVVSVTADTRFSIIEISAFAKHWNGLFHQKRNHIDTPKNANIPTEHAAVYVKMIAFLEKSIGDNLIKSFNGMFVWDDCVAKRSILAVVSKKKRWKKYIYVCT